MLPLALAALATLAPEPQELEAGALAPPGAWTTHGGCAAHTRQSASAPPLGGVALAWTLGIEGTLEGEPLAEGNHVVLSYLKSDGQRALLLADLRDGARVGEERVFETDLPLEPTLWNGFVVVRSDARALTGFRMTWTGLHPRWTWFPSAELGPPLLFEDELYATTGDRLVRLEAGSLEPVWEAPGPYHGRPALRGQHLYLPGLDDQDAASVCVLERATGRELSRTAPVQAPGNEPHRPDHSFVAAMRETLFLYLERPLPWTRTLDTHSLGLPNPPPLSPGASAGRSQPVAFLFHLAQAADSPSGWFGLKRSEDGPTSWVRSRGGKGAFVTVASPEHHARLTAYRSPPSVAGGVLLLGPVAVDAQSLRVLWRVEGDVLGPVIPLQYKLLVVRDARTVELWSESRLGDGVELPFVEPFVGDQRFTDATAVIEERGRRGGRLRAPGARRAHRARQAAPSRPLEGPRPEDPHAHRGRPAPHGRRGADPARARDGLDAPRPGHADRARPGERVRGAGDRRDPRPGPAAARGGDRAGARLRRRRGGARTPPAVPRRAPQRSPGAACGGCRGDPLPSRRARVLSKRPAPALHERPPSGRRADPLRPAPRDPGPPAHARRGAGDAARAADGDAARAPGGRAGAPCGQPGRGGRDPAPAPRGHRSSGAAGRRGVAEVPEGDPDLPGDRRRPAGRRLRRPDARGARAGAGHRALATGPEGLP